MHFNIDKQTLEELNLLGKFRQGSVYGLFSQVKTRGGERLLDEMFRHPLEEAAAINARSAVFQYFQQVRMSFPFDIQQVSLMREYMDGSSGKSALLTLASAMIKRLLSGLTRDERYRKDVLGLHATIVTLHRCYSFAAMPGWMDGPYAARIASIQKILSDPLMERLRDTDIYKAMPVKTLAYYDHLLKGRFREDMEDILSFVYEVDVNIAVSDVSRARAFSYARAMSPEKNVLTVEGLCHPAIGGAVSNSLSLHQERNVLFLTGANMAGKSTLMKSVGIGLYLAHMGFPVAASIFEFSVREGLYSSINVADNIHLGYSHFYAEVVRVKQAAEAAASGKRLVLMFDELFKGTNVKDAYDGTLAITAAFSEYRNCLFIVSTHIIEVGEALKSRNNIHFVYMPTVMDGPRPRYTYRLQEGITEDRQGMMIIRNEGILELINS